MRPRRSPRTTRRDPCLPRPARSPRRVWRRRSRRRSPEGAVVVDEGITSSGAYLPLSTGCAAIDLSRAHRRRDRLGSALRHRSGARGARPQGHRARRRRQRALHHPVAVDAGARAAQRREHRVRQRHLPHPADRAAARRHRSSRPQGLALTDLAQPAVDWSGIAKGFGVPWSRADTAEALSSQLERAIATPGPALIEVRVPGAARPGIP